MTHGKILIIGDIMLDVSTYGSCTRVSPEAPVPVVTKEGEVSTLGGAGNNLVNLYHLNVETDLITVIGSDERGCEVRQLVQMFASNAVIIPEDRRTTVKNRILAQNHQVLRVDTEDTHHIAHKSESAITEYVSKNIKDYNIILISDYNKGVCTPSVFRHTIDVAKKHNVKVICDPKKHDISLYSGCYMITPNRTEAELMCKMSIKTDEEIAKAINIMKRYVEHPIITLSEEGISYMKGSTLCKSYATAKSVVDVTGAGDTVISTICYHINKGGSIPDAIHLANKAASYVVEKLGTSYISEDDLTMENKKILHHASSLKNLNKKIVFTNGCFDIIHAGHIKYLREAKKLGDILVVGINSDESIKALKGDDRPINSLNARMEVMSSLEFVDYIISFSEETPINLIKEIKPEVLVKGGDYKIENIVGNGVAKETIVIPFVDGFSTTGIINKSLDSLTR
ncbi:MAG: D-beta-D-heptose 7-phosphate kinase/D-beta-D-heptose 1-phosphate adenosyltransferase [Candidatus Deianiraeaceae bacterium]|jgi:D-beta-D-heptose 7-phosphate kinase/D-beta-D-heptose 1-phosphate adenosyltransferase